MSHMQNDPLVIAGTEYRSRLLTGTGKYKDLEETRAATEAAGAEIVTVAIRRTNIGQNPDEPNLLDALPGDVPCQNRTRDSGEASLRPRRAGGWFRATQRRGACRGSV